jgi:hypothetical protein
MIWRQRTEVVKGYGLRGWKISVDIDLGVICVLDFKIYTSVLAGLIASVLRVEDGRNMFLWNVGLCLEFYTALLPRRRKSTATSSAASDSRSCSTDNNSCSTSSAEWLALLLCIREFHCLNLDMETCYSVFHVFPQFLQLYAGIVP